MTVAHSEARDRIRDREDDVPSRHSLIQTGLFAAVLTFATAAWAGGSDEPWTPKKFPQSELIDFGNFEKTPLEFPWKTIRVEQVATGSGVDFKHILDADYSEVEQHFDDAFEEQRHALKLKPFAATPGVSRKLIVTGLTTQDDILRITLGSSDTRRQYNLELTREEGKAVLTFENDPYSMIFSAGVPKRAPFTPVDAGPIPVED